MKGQEEEERRKGKIGRGKEEERKGESKGEGIGGERKDNIMNNLQIKLET